MSVTDWIANKFGRSVRVIEHAGGMSPGCASTLVLDDGNVIFMKTVGTELNAGTVSMYRDEASLLEVLPEAPYRPKFLGFVDDGEWVTIVLEHIDGRYPDLDDDKDFEAVSRLIELQMEEFSPPPPGVSVVSLEDAVASRWIPRWREIELDPGRFLPRWAVERLDEVMDQVLTVPSALGRDCLVHFDVRNDNLLIRPSGDAAIFDWGMARIGPAWIDCVILAMQKSNPAEALRAVERRVAPSTLGLAMAFVLTMAGAEAWGAQQPVVESLATMNDFRRAQARRLFALAELGT